MELFDCFRAKPKKILFVLSTMHPDLDKFKNKKKPPETVNFCNHRKYIVDAIDKMAKKYSVRTGT